METKVEEDLKSTDNPAEDYMDRIHPPNHGGGILADESGMGKGVQAIMLALNDKPLTKTLIICPLVSLSQWKTEISRLDMGATVFVCEQGLSNTQDLSQYDFVITSYKAIRRGYKSLSCPHCQVHLRSIKPRHFCDTSSQSGHFTLLCGKEFFLRGEDRAIYALNARFRWVLTGTFGELFPMILEKRHNSERHIHRLESSLVLREAFISEMVLQRRKKDITVECVYPPSNVIVKRIPLNGTEKVTYDSLEGSIRQEFYTYVRDTSLRENSARIFNLINRLKQVSIHLDLVDLSEDCHLCKREAEDAVILPCKHVFCYHCFMTMYPHRVTSKTSMCPICNQSFSSNLVFCTSLKQKKKRVKAKGTITIPCTSCTRIEALREEITLMLETDASAKAVIFSRYKGFLGIIYNQLTQSGMACVQLIKSDDAKSALEVFNEDGRCKFLLTTFKLSGGSLNLSVASHAFFMDAGWDPISDKQAENRVNNMRQGKATRIVKFIAENTIEERIIKLLGQKEDILAGVHKDSEAIEKLTEEDMLFLLSS